MFTDFSSRKNSILSAFKQAKADLEQLNKDIDSEIISNNETISALQIEQANLKALKSSNNTSIKGLTSFIGK